MYSRTCTYKHREPFSCCALEDLISTRRNECVGGITALPHAAVQCPSRKAYAVTYARLGSAAAVSCRSGVDGLSRCAEWPLQPRQMSNAAANQRLTKAPYWSCNGEASCSILDLVYPPIPPFSTLDRQWTEERTSYFQHSGDRLRRSVKANLYIHVSQSLRRPRSEHLTQQQLRLCGTDTKNAA